MPLTELDDARRKFSAQVVEWRQATEEKTGLRLRSRGWWVLMLAGAVGLALGTRAASRRTGDR